MRMQEAVYELIQEYCSCLRNVDVEVKVIRTGASHGC